LSSKPPEQPAFSSRFDWEQNQNRLSRLLQRKRSAGAELLDLTESNPTRAGLTYPNKEILAALADPAAMVYEPAAAGMKRARQAVSGYYASKGIDVAPDRILLTASTSEAYSYLFKLLTDPGDEVLAPRPSYPLFDFLARMDAVRLQHYSLRYDEGWWIDLASVEAAVSDRTRAILIVNPNNPTGSFLKRKELDGLLEICRRRGLALISDEVFSDYPLRSDPNRVDSVAANRSALLFSLNGFSKILGLPQMKLGWIVVSGPGEFRRAAVDRLETIADTYLSVAAPVQIAAERWFAFRKPFQQALRNRLASNRQLVEDAVRGSSCRLLETEGGWYAVLQLPRTRDEEDWALTFLQDDNVVVQPGFFFDFPTQAHAVLSLLTPAGILRDGMQRLLRRVAADC